MRNSLKFKKGAKVQNHQKSRKIILRELSGPIRANRFSLRKTFFLRIGLPENGQQRGLDANHANSNANRREDAIRAIWPSASKIDVDSRASIRANLRNVGVRIAGPLSQGICSSL